MGMARSCRLLSTHSPLSALPKICRCAHACPGIDFFSLYHPICQGHDLMLVLSVI